MSDESTASGLTRRDLLRHSARLAGAVLALNGVPRFAGAVFASPFDVAQQAAGDAAAAMRKQLGAVPITSTPLADKLTMLSGPGGNVVVLNGPDGKAVVDTFVQSAWDKLKPLLDGMSNAPIKVAIDTHWHLDHSDNNENFRAASAELLAHENTAKRLAEPHDLLGMHFDPWPAAAMPTKTFKATERLDMNGEQVHLGYAPPAHTDTDIYIHFAKGNVLHMGDLFFNGSYPFIDTSTGGNIGGMIAAADSMLKLVDDSTKIVPGHGPLGDKAALTRYHDVMVTVRDRVQTLKTSGQSLEQVIAKKPTAELDEQWGKGFVPPDLFVTIVYNSL
jgi:glyoxylase-like metal-dependent hydrolase (beta-lactamase superfamily II)